MHHSKKHSIPVTLAVTVTLATCSPRAVAEPAILVSLTGLDFSKTGIARFDPATGEFVGFHVPPGRNLGFAGMDVGVDGNIYVASELMHNILSFDLQTGQFSEVFIPYRSGGLGTPAHMSINTTAACSLSGGAITATAADGGDDMLYVMSKDSDAILRYRTPVAAATTAGSVAGVTCPCNVEEGQACPGPGEPCAGPRGTRGSAVFIPGSGDLGGLNRDFMKPRWDCQRDLHSTLAGNGVHRRYEGATGYEKGSGSGFPLDYVSQGSGGLGAEPMHGILGPFHNLYLGNGGLATCVEGSVKRYAGPLPPECAGGDAAGQPCTSDTDCPNGFCDLDGIEGGALDTRGDCFNLIEGEECPGPLADLITYPDTATVIPEVVPSACPLIVAPYFGPDGNLYVNVLMSLNPGNLLPHILRFAGPVPDGEDTRGPCAGMQLGEACPGPLGAPGTAEFIPVSTFYDGSFERIPYDVMFVDLPPWQDPVPANDTCVSATVLDSVSELAVPFDNRGSDTDGPATQLCGLVGSAVFSADVWYHYRPPSNGILQVSTVESIPCACRHDGDPLPTDDSRHCLPPGGTCTDCTRCALDTMVAVYGGGPDCECPIDDSTLLACNDDTVQYEDWSGIGAPSATTIEVQQGMCYTIRLGTWSDPPQYPEKFGAADLNLQMLDCVASTAPTVQQIAHADGSLVPASGNRFLSIEAGDPGREQAIRVTLVSLPPPFDVWNGSHLFAGAPSQLSELGSKGFGDDVPPENGFLTVAKLQCEVLMQDWSAVGPIHMYHEGIVPGGVYDVQVVDSTCGPSFEESYSAAATISNAQWSDVVGAFNAGEGYWGAADDSVDVATDVVAMLDKFTGAETSPSKFRMDLEPAAIDGIINITDAVRILDGFTGKPYPFAPSGPPPCE